MSIGKLPEGDISAASVLVFRDMSTGDTSQAPVSALAPIIQAAASLRDDRFITQYEAPGGTVPAPAPVPVPPPPPPPPPAPTPPSPAPGPAPAPSPAPPPVGTVITSLVVREMTGVAGTYPYTAAFRALPGAIPSGSALQSPDDGSLRAAVLVSHPDGSVALAVVGGTATLAANGTINVRLQAGTPVAGTNLTPTRFADLAASASVAFTGGLSTTNTWNPSSPPTRVWWATPTHICASWTQPVMGNPSMCVVWTAHAWAASSRVWVQCTVENSLVTTTAPVDFTSATYSATVTIGGVAQAPVLSSGSPEGVHVGSRAWYAEGWIGGAQDVLATMSHTYLQTLPELFRIDQPSTFNFATYAGDAYIPWGNGRIAASNMGGTGDVPGIGPLPQWECRTLQSGDARGWRATITSALSALSYNINTRDAATGLIPTFTAIGTRGQGAGWPRHVPAGSGGGVRGWEVAHAPDVGLMAFYGRPSPVFIELAQKAAVWCGTVYTGFAFPITWQAGVAGGYYQTRGKAWAIRAIAHATLLSPDGLAWKAAGATALERNVALLEGYKDDPRNTLGYVWYLRPDRAGDFSASAPGFQQPMWMHHFLAGVLHRAERAVGYLLGAEAGRFEDLADWACEQPVRFITESTGGEWRFLPYIDTVGNSNIDGTNGTPEGSGINSQNLMTQEADWGAQRAEFFAGSVPALAGPWRTHPGTPQQYTTGWEDDAVGGYYYVEPFMDALNCAVERGVTDAGTAYDAVLTNVTNYSTWRAGFGFDPRFGSVPRGYIAGGWGTGTDAGTYNAGTRVWTPGRDGDGRVNAASVALLPANEFAQVAGTRLDALDAVVKAAIPGWNDRGASDWEAVLDNWVGFGYDERDGVADGWIIFSGGHTDGANTGVYKHDFLRMRWDLELLPIDPAFLDARWNISFLTNTAGFSSFTQYPAAWYYYIGNEANPEGVYYDEHFDPSQADPRFSTRRPTSRHPYGSQVVIPKPGGGVRVMAHCRRYWEYDSATKTFSLPVFPFGNQTNYTGNRGYTGENMDAWWNEAEQRYYVASTQDAGDGRTLSCQPGGINWRSEGAYPLGGYPSRYKAMEQRGTTLHTLRWAGTSDPGFNAPGRPHAVLRTNLGTRATTTNLVTLGSSFTGKTFANEPDSGYWDTGGFTWIEPLGKYLCVVNTVQDGNVLAWIDGTTWVCELATIPGQPASVVRIENKIRYWEDLGIVTLVDRASLNTRVMRVEP